MSEAGMRTSSQPTQYFKSSPSRFSGFAYWSSQKHYFHLVDWFISRPSFEERPMLKRHSLLSSRRRFERHQCCLEEPVPSSSRPACCKNSAGKAPRWSLRLWTGVSGILNCKLSAIEEITGIHTKIAVGVVNRQPLRRRFAACVFEKLDLLPGNTTYQPYGDLWHTIRL